MATGLGDDDIYEDLTLADIAAKAPILPAYSDVDRVELLDGIAQLIGRRAELRAKFYREAAEPSELRTALIEAERGTANLMASLADMAGVLDIKDNPDEALAEAILVLPDERRESGIKFALAVRRQAEQLAAIGAAAASLSKLVSDFLGQMDMELPDVRANAVQQEFLGQAADAWTMLTGKPAGKSKKGKGGPFIRFAAALWLAASMPTIPEDELIERLGNTFQKMRK